MSVYIGLIELCNRTFIYIVYIIEVYIYNRNYKYSYIKEPCQQVFIYNEEAHCTSHISFFHALELSQSHFIDGWKTTLFL